MMVLQRRQLLAALAVLLLYSPVFLSVSVPAIGTLWSGARYMIFVVALMVVFVGMAWFMLRLDFVERDGGASGEDEAA